MIYLTRLNHAPIIVNADLIENIENTPDTVITLTNGHKIVILETAAQVVDRVVQFRRSIHQPPAEPDPGRPTQTG